MTGTHVPAQEHPAELVSFRRLPPLRFALLFIAVLAGIALVSAVVVTYIYTLQWGSSGAGAGNFDTPMGIAVNATGYVYVADSGNDRIQIFDPSGNFIREWTTWGGATPGPFTNPTAVATDLSGDVYVADTNNHRVVVFDPSGNFIREIGTGVAPGDLSNPAGIAVNSSGYVYVGDMSNDRVQVFDSTGVYIRGWGIFGSNPGEFKSPRGLETNTAGSVYVADSDNDRVQAFDPSGNFIRTWGGTGSGDGQFSCPVDIAIDSSGNIYVLDCENHRVQEFTPSGDYLYKWGQLGAGNGDFKFPYGLDFNATGTLHVADSSNDRVQVFTPTPVIASVSPATGGVTGGDMVTITGAGLAYASGVMFGTTPAASFSWQSDTQIRAVAPAHAEGTVDIIVTAPGGTSPVSAADRFTFTNPPVVNSQSGSSNDGDDRPVAVSRIPVTITVNVGGNSAVSRVTATGTGISGLIVTAMTRPGPGSVIQPPPGRVYQYIEILPARFTTINEATITFTIPAAWLDENNIPPENIVLDHSENGQWIALPTTIVSTANGFVTFTATTPSFSLFAISAKPREDGNITASPTVALPTDPVASSTLEKHTEAPVTTRAIVTLVTPVMTTVAPVMADTSQAGLPVPAFVFIIAGLILLAGSGFIVRRWWIRKQNPTLFAEYD